MTEQEFQEFANKAQLGDAEAQNKLGNSYYNGEGVTQDYAKAVEWYTKAADAGNVRSMNELAHIYVNEESFKDLYKAFHYFKLAALQGDLNSIENLGGFCYLYGNGVEKNVEAALNWLSLAIKLGADDEWTKDRFQKAFDIIGNIDRNKSIEYINTTLVSSKSLSKKSLFGQVYIVSDLAVESFNKERKRREEEEERKRREEEERKRREEEERKRREEEERKRREEEERKRREEEERKRREEEERKRREEEERKYREGLAQNGIGKFSVSQNKKVTFSIGNLYLDIVNYYFLDYFYVISNWRHGNIHYELSDSCHYGMFGGRELEYSHLYFQWRKSNKFNDWGNERIINGGNQPHQWRTLSIDEWGYLCFQRKNANNLIGGIKIEADDHHAIPIHGLVILPDDCKLPSKIKFTPGYDFFGGKPEDLRISMLKLNNHINFYTWEEWLELEQYGAVLLPLAANNGFYWSCSVFDDNKYARALLFSWSGPDMFEEDWTEASAKVPFDAYCFVRLVKDL